MGEAANSTDTVTLAAEHRPDVVRLLVGVSGYLLKSVDRHELVSAIRSVHTPPH